MKKLSLLFMALLATTALWASNVITYTASNKLAEVQEGKFRFGGAIHVDAFNVPISSHTFSDGIGTITFAGEVTTIGEQAFYQCNFTSINIPNSVDSIGEYAFNGCGLLTITLPESVTGIGNSAFANCDSLASVMFPDSINIGVYAFSQCHSLRSVNFGNRANSIEYSAFRGCDSLSTLTISSGVTRIEDLAFSDCPSLKTVFWNAKKCDLGSLIFNQSWQIESFVFGDSVQEIPNSLCSRLVKLTTISIPNSVTKIGESAFASCTGLTSITIPNNVSYIGNKAFEYCTGVSSVTVPDGVSYVGVGAFYGIKNLIYHGSLTDAPWGACCLNGTLEGYLIYSDTTKKKLCSCLTIATGAIDIPNTVDTIADCAFAGCTSITSITIPNNVSYIGNSAFEECTGLKSTVLPNSVKYIGSLAFYGCTSLQSVTLPQTLTSIQTSTFSGCEKLASITIPNSVTEVGESAFSRCISFPVVDNLRYADTYLVEAVDRSLSTYAIKDGTKWIGSSAFAGCYNLTSISIPNSVTSIGSSAFTECSSLKSITFPNSMKSIERGVFYYCSSLSAITIPASVIRIGERAFALCDSLASIDVDRDNTMFSSIDGVLFNYEKDSLIQYPMGNPRTSYTIPNGVTRIGIWSFYKQYYYNSPLQAITIPSSVTHIGKCAFLFCNPFTSITCYAITPPTCGERCFDQIDKSIPINIPGGCAEDYKKAEEWKDFTNFVSIFPFGKCGSDLRWNYADGTLSISGTGSMYNYTTGDTAPWMQFYKDSIANIVIANGATSIGDYAFYGLSNKNFKKTDLPNSVTTIGQYAFANCTYLKNFSMGTDVEEIKTKAFDNDQKLLYVTCYTLEPPTLATDAFVNWDANLNVPCEAVADYKMSVGWKLFNKDNITCIGAEPTTTTDVVVTPTDNSVTITWPTSNGADSYTIVINKDGVPFCTLTFNAQGQLNNIAFAPGRGSSNDVAMAEAVAGGYKFTITSLNPGTKYNYEIDTQNASGTSIANYTGTFTTTGSTGMVNVNENVNVNRKLIRDGQLIILRDGKMYNALGGEL